MGTAGQCSRGRLSPGSAAGFRQHQDPLHAAPACTCHALLPYRSSLPSSALPHAEPSLLPRRPASPQILAQPSQLVMATLERPLGIEFEEQKRTKRTVVAGLTPGQLTQRSDGGCRRVAHRAPGTVAGKCGLPPSWFGHQSHTVL